jgi:LCP family protein required for cell wall assembly
MTRMVTPPPTSDQSSAPGQPLLAAAFSAILPGTGQMYTGNWRLGRNLLLIDIGILAVLLFFFHDKLSIAKAFVRPSALAIMMIASIGLLGYRLWAANDAYQLARATNSSENNAPQVAVVAFVLVMAVLLIPHGVFAYYSLTQYDLITTVFASGQGTGVPASSSSAVVQEESSGDDAATPDGPSGAPSTTNAPAVSSIWDGSDRLNILLIGGDGGIGRTGIRTDSMITVSIDPQTGETAMFQVPRNWTYAPLPEGVGVWDCNCYPGLTNELWVMGEQYPDAFPGPGTPSENAVKAMTSEFLGIPIHYYALVNLDGFVDLVDALGGVDIYVPNRIVDNEFPSFSDGTITTLAIEQGQQHMDGALALAYSRTRHQDSDYHRMFRQRCILEGLLDQTDPVSLLLNFGSLSEVIQEAMITDLPIDALPEFVDLMPLIDRDEIVSIRFIPPEYHLKFRDDGEPGRIANIDLVHEHVQLILEDPERARIELELEETEECPTAPDA